jgi:hypothetical protein
MCTERTTPEIVTGRESQTAHLATIAEACNRNVEKHPHSVVEKAIKLRKANDVANRQQ